MRRQFFLTHFLPLLKGVLLLLMLILPGKVYALEVGDKSPDFRLVTTQGMEISYDRDIKGKKPAYLFFWTTW